MYTLLNLLNAVCLKEHSLFIHIRFLSFLRVRKHANRNLIVDILKEPVFFSLYLKILHYSLSGQCRFMINAACEVHNSVLFLPLILQWKPIQEIVQ